MFNFQSTYFRKVQFSISVFSQNKDCKCCTEKHAEFDFWIGSWTVTDAKENLAGTSVIDKIQNNCVLRENWKSAKGSYTGTSSNFYNHTTNQWEQMWLDNQGESLHLKGNKIGNKMILKTDEVINKDGKSFFNRVTWTFNEDGTIRQYWEMVTDNTEIIVAFNGLYKKTE